MKLSKLRHVGILIKDWEKIRPFYEDLGFLMFYEQEETWWPDKKLMVRKMKNKHGDVLEFITGEWFRHIALAVDELPLIRHARFSRHKPKLYIAFTQDPEGNWIEFVKEL